MAGVVIIIYCVVADSCDVIVDDCSVASSRDVASGCREMRVYQDVAVVVDSHNVIEGCESVS
jgi:hypothetical protein